MGHRHLRCRGVGPEADVSGLAIGRKLKVPLEAQQLPEPRGPLDICHVDDGEGSRRHPRRLRRRQDSSPTLADGRHRRVCCLTCSPVLLLNSAAVTLVVGENAATRAGRPAGDREPGCVGTERPARRAGSKEREDRHTQQSRSLVSSVDDDEPRRSSGAPRGPRRAATAEVARIRRRGAGPGDSRECRALTAVDGMDR